MRSFAIGICLSAGTLLLNPKIASSSGNGLHPNVLWIMLDAARADHFSSYGYEKKTTPRMDEIAERGALFSLDFSPGTMTQESLAKILSSRRRSIQIFAASGNLWGARTDAPEETFLGLDPQQAFLPDLMRANGYHTVLFTDHRYLIGAPYFVDMFDERFFFGPEKENRRILKLHLNTVFFPDVVGWLRKNKDKKFFAYIHVLSPHWGTYLSPAEILNGISWRLQESLSKKLYSGDGETSPWIRDGRTGWTPEDVEAFRAIYDKHLEMLDREVGRIFDELRASGLDRNTLLIISSDHGESLGEHSLASHGGPPWDSVTHVPLLLVYPPAIAPGVKIHGLTESIDIPPTILDYCGLELPADKTFDGASLREFVEHPDEGKAAVFWPGGMRTNHYKYMAPYAWFETPPMDGFPGLSPHATLYDLDRDPGETRDVASLHPEIIAEMRTRQSAAMRPSDERFLRSKTHSPPRSGFEFGVFRFKPAPLDSVQFVDRDDRDDLAAETGGRPWLMNVHWARYGLYRLFGQPDRPLNLTAIVPDGRYRVTALIRADKESATPADIGLRFRIKPSPKFTTPLMTFHYQESIRAFIFGFDLGETVVTNDAFTTDVTLAPSDDKARYSLRRIRFEPLNPGNNSQKEEARNPLIKRLMQAGYW